MRRSVFGFYVIATILIMGLAFTAIACSKQESDTDDVMSDVTKDDRYVNPVVYELIMNELMRSSGKWNGLDHVHKLRAVEGFLMLMRTQENAKIEKPADYYVTRLDEMTSQNPKAEQTIPMLLRVLAIMDYDFDNGQDKDKLALDVLGPKLFEANKSRLALVQKK